MAEGAADQAQDSTGTASGSTEIGDLDSPTPGPSEGPDHYASSDDADQGGQGTSEGSSDGGDGSSD